MRYILLILAILISGCATPQLYPLGVNGTQVAFHIDYKGKIICSLCKEETMLFKASKDKKFIVCNKCFRKKYLK